jgi:hypothetical protein
LIPLRRLAREQWPFLALLGAYFVGLYAVPVVLAGFSTPRYTINPLLLLLSMVGYVVANAGPQLGRGARLTLEAGIALVLLTQWVLDYAPENPRSRGPAWSAELARAREACEKDETERAELLLPPLPRQRSEAHGGGTTPRWTLTAGCRRLAPASPVAEELPVGVGAQSRRLPPRIGPSWGQHGHPYDGSRPSCAAPRCRFGYPPVVPAAPVTFPPPEDTHPT